MTEIQNSKPVYDLEEKTFQISKDVRLFVKTSILENQNKRNLSLLFWSLNIGIWSLFAIWV